MTRDGPMWDPGLWEDIREAMRRETERAAAVRQFLPRVIVAGDTTTVNADRVEEGESSLRIDPNNETLPVFEIYAEFQLTAQQVEREDSHHEGRSSAVTLARFLARAEDSVLLHAYKDDAGGPLWPNLVRTRGGNVEKGLISASRDLDPVGVPHSDDHPNRYLDNVVEGVETAIKQLQDEEHYGPFALLLPPVAHADAKTPLPNTLVVPMDLIARDVETVGRSRLLEYSEGKEPLQAGLVVSLGGNSMDLVVPNEDYDISFVQVDKDGLYVFRVNHRFILRLKRKKAVVRLEFAPKGAAS